MSIRNLSFTFCLLLVLNSTAAEIKVEFDIIPPAGATPAPSAIGPNAARANEVPFNSVGQPSGSLVTNRTGSTIKAVIMTLTSAGDTFDPASTGGNLFPDVELSADKKTIVFKGGNIPNRDSFWMRMPRSAAYSGVGRYTGKAIVEPPLPPPPPPRVAPVQPPPPQQRTAPVVKGLLAVGKSSGASLNYSFGTLSFSISGVDFVRYSDGTVLNSNDTAETILGRDLVVSDLTLTPTANADGSYTLSAGAVGVMAGNLMMLSDQTLYIIGGLGDCAVYPDSSVPGFDSVIVGTVFTPESSLGLTSRFVTEYHSDTYSGVDTVFVFRSSILSATSNFTQSGNSTGKASIEVSADTKAPTILVPADTILQTNNSLGLAVDYDVFVYDNQDKTPSLVCSPASGSLFPVGTTVVSCVAKDASGNESLASFQITIQGPGGSGGGANVPGSGASEDFDGDGFTNSLDDDDDNDGISDLSETLAGSDPFNAASVNKVALSVKKVSGALNFVKSSADMISLSGILPNVPENLNPEGKQFALNIGGVRESFTLDKKGKAKSATGSVQLKLKLIRDRETKQVSSASGDVPFSIKLSKGTWSDELTDEGIDPSADASNLPLTLSLELILNGRVYSGSSQASYTGRAGKSGRFK